VTRSARHQPAACRIFVHGQRTSPARAGRCRRLRPRRWPAQSAPVLWRRARGADRDDDGGVGDQFGIEQRGPGRWRTRRRPRAHVTSPRLPRATISAPSAGVPGSARDQMTDRPSGRYGASTAARVAIWPCACGPAPRTARATEPVRASAGDGCHRYRGCTRRERRAVQHRDQLRTRHEQQVEA
jgi:hypothetical protein